ncbi:hypothetical protein BC830DRAFT_1163439 [Chytriomyces sp. MP71]|nr:hypothetical protein BC830DRAFT_1163439 [Chytriomyces sp. MP71]
MATAAVASVDAQTWCGKRYTYDSHADAPSSWPAQAPAPEHKDAPFFALFPRHSLFTFTGERGAADVTMTAIAQFRFSSLAHSSFETEAECIVSATDQATGVLLLHATVAFTASPGMQHSEPTLVEWPLRIPSSWEPRWEPFNITATAQCSNSLELTGNWSSESQLVWLPEPLSHHQGEDGHDVFRMLQTSLDSITPMPKIEDCTRVHGASRRVASVVRLDFRLGKARPALIYDTLEQDGTWSSRVVFPYGHYINWGRYLSQNIDAALRNISNEGHTIMNPSPPFDDLSVPGTDPNDPFGLIHQVINKGGDLGIMTQYNMRHTFKNKTSVHQQVTRFRSERGLGVWYTSDEPDGEGEIFEDVMAASAQIRALDPYHPVSLVLNCKSHHLPTYARTVDILMTDVYSVGVNLTFSETRWRTPCNATFGCCGCDGCMHGGARDVVERMQGYVSELRAAHVDRGVWMVVQAFGESEYWVRIPTPAEVRVMVYGAVVAGSTGIMYWLRPEPRLVGVLAKIGMEVRALTRVLTSFVYKMEADAGEGDLLEGVYLASWRDPVSGSSKLKVVDHLDQDRSTVATQGGDIHVWKEAVIIIANTNYRQVALGQSGLCFEALKGFDGTAKPFFESGNTGSELYEQDDIDEEQDFWMSSSGVHGYRVASGCVELDSLERLQVLVLSLFKE